MKLSVASLSSVAKDFQLIKTPGKIGPGNARYSQSMGLLGEKQILEQRTVLVMESMVEAMRLDAKNLSKEQ